MSQSLWQIGKRDLNAFFSPEQQTFQIWVCHNFIQYEIWSLIFGWTRYKTGHRVEEVCCSKCFIVSVMSFHLYFDKQVHKKLKKKKLSKQKKKKRKRKTIKSLNFAESNVHRKTKRARQLWDIQFIFFSLIDVINHNWKCKNNIIVQRKKLRPIYFHPIYW